MKPQLSNDNITTALLRHTTPDHVDVVDDVQATLVAIIPLQVQPEVMGTAQVPGQLTIPCLKAHKELASDCC